MFCPCPSPLVTAIKGFKTLIGFKDCTQYNITPILAFPNKTWRVLDFSDLLIISDSECILKSEDYYS